MKLIVGLGNPGKEYENTRHNVGTRVVEVLLARHGGAEPPKTEKKFDALIWRLKIGEEKVILLTSGHVFMNEMGIPVQKAARFWKIKPQDVLVAYDDKELPLGRLRLRKNGSAGGHNGMKSVMQMLYTTNVPRLRLGVGTPRSKDIDAAAFVLGKFTKNEQAVVDAMTAEAADAIEVMLAEGMDAAMNKYNPAE